MSKFVLTLVDDFKLVFDIMNTSIAQRWATEITKDYPLYEVNRFKSWPNDGKDLEYYRNNLSEQIRIVNNYAPVINNTEIKSQDDLNYLHKFFEDLRGPASSGTEFFNNAPREVQLAVEQFNVLIHECEHVIRNANYPEVVVTYSDRPRFKLIADDFEHFTFKWEFGCVYINYCEVGKTLLDVFKDQDLYVGDANVKPLEYYSSDFVIKFGPSTPEEVYEYRLKKFNEWYDNYHLKFKYRALGLIPVAKLNLQDSGLAKCTATEIIQAISKHREVKNTCIK
jgi:hypothetical protein